MPPGRSESTRACKGVRKFAINKAIMKLIEKD